MKKQTPFTIKAINSMMDHFDQNESKDNHSEDYNNTVIMTAKDYDMAKWKVKEIYDRYYPNRFYEKMEDALKEREQMEDCSW